jgi:hypothetical protein
MCLPVDQAKSGNNTIFCVFVFLCFVFLFVLFCFVLFCFIEFHGIVVEIATS